MEELDNLLSTLPGFKLLSPAMKTAALTQARVPDAAGVWPEQPNYIETFDVYYAALMLLPWLEAQPVVRQASSEGTSTAVDAPNWASLRAHLRSMSPICTVTGSGILTLEPIPDVTHVRRVPMDAGRDVSYGDVNTSMG